MNYKMYKVLYESILFIFSNFYKNIYIISIYGLDTSFYNVNRGTL